MYKITSIQRMSSPVMLRACMPVHTHTKYCSFVVSVWNSPDSVLVFVQIFFSKRVFTYFFLAHCRVIFLSSVDERRS